MSYTKTSGVYALVFRTGHGEMIYVGSTIRSLRERFSKHCNQLKNGVHHNPNLQNHWNKYGQPEFRVLEYCDGDQAYVLAREQFYIDGVEKSHLLNCGPAIPNPMAGRHLSQSAKDKLSRYFKGRSVSQETREKISRAHQGKQGRPHTPAECQKMSEAQRGRTHTPETKTKIGRAHKGRVVKPETREKLRQVNLGSHNHTPEGIARTTAAHLGSHHTEEAKEKIGAANRGKIVSSETREKIGRASKGRVPSAETRAKIGAAGRGRVKSKETIEKTRQKNIGRVVSQETREKISIAAKERYAQKRVASQDVQAMEVEG